LEDGLIVGALSSKEEATSRISLRVFLDCMRA
jgi:hypothetical protein